MECYKEPLSLSYSVHDSSYRVIIQPKTYGLASQLCKMKVDNLDLDSTVREKEQDRFHWKPVDFKIIDFIF